MRRSFVRLRVEAIECVQKIRNSPAPVHDIHILVYPGMPFSNRSCQIYSVHLKLSLLIQAQDPELP
jgi:hypothetical protein